LFAKQKNLQKIVFQEQEQMHRYNKRMEEELLARHRQEKIRLPRFQRTESRARMTMFKKSLKVQGYIGNEREQIKQVL